MRSGVHGTSRAAVWATAWLAALLLVLAGCGGGGSGGSIAPPPPPPTLTITTSTLPDGINGVAYTQTTVQASGGSGARTWSATGLPAGLSIGASTGTISGTPTAAPGTFTVTVQVQDSGSPPQTNSRQLTIRIFDPLVISATPLANGAVGVAYPTQTVTASGGLAAFTWDVSAGSLPAGLSLSASTTNSVTVSGTPTAGGASTFTLRVRDSLSPQQADTQEFTVQILQITTASLPDGVQNQTYGPVSLGVIGNVGTLTWSQTGLPANLLLDPSTGVISGASTAFGTFTVNVTVTDSDVPRSTTRALGLFIAQELVLDATPLVGGTTGMAYTQTRVPTGGTPPYTWSEPTASFDTVTGEGVGTCQGLTLDFEMGTIAGMPVSVGTCGPFTLRVRDSASPQQFDEAPFSIVIGPGPLSIVTTSLPPGAVTRGYSQTLQATGGTPPLTWSEPTAPSFFSDTTGAGIVATPCEGLTLSFLTGTITGTPVNPGTCGPFDLRVTDSAPTPDSDLATFSILINPEPVGRNDTVARATVLPPTNGNQTIEASISPFADPPTVTTGNPDQDFYKLSAAAGVTVTVEIFARRLTPASPIDPVIQIVRDNGTPNGEVFPNNCNDPGDDNPPAELVPPDGPLTPDPTPTAFDDLCINDDILLGSNRDSRLEFRVPGSGTVEFFVRVLDFRGDARPDLRYNLTITGAN